MDSRYSDWLRRAVPSEVTWQTKLSELRRVEGAYGDLDKLYDEDELEGVIGELTYSAESERAGSPNPSRLKIDGNVRNSLASYKSAVNKYVRFRGEIEREVAPVIMASSEEAIVEQSLKFSLERDLQFALRRSIGQLEAGLVVADGGQERSTPSGRIDILARDSGGQTVIIELKSVKASRDAVAQVLAYMGDLTSPDSRDVRGMLVAPEFDPRAVSAAKVVPNLKLIQYSFTFNFAALEKAAI